MTVITANPKSAGLARWIFLALYGAKLGKSKKAAIDFVTKASPCLPVCLFAPGGRVCSSAGQPAAPGRRYLLACPPACRPVLHAWVAPSACAAPP